MRDEVGWAELPQTGGPALAEWLEGASCGPRVKAVAVRAVQAAGADVSAEQWRRDLLAQHPEASALVAEAEECMRGAGLWPWHDTSGARAATGRESMTREKPMTRVDYRTMFPDGVHALLELERAVHASALEPELLELVRVRASQINGCTYCLAMHNRDARARGEHQTRLDTVAAWREAPYYTARERAALAWCEALTELPRTGAPDEVYAALEVQFSPPEIAALTFAVVAINSWNRLAVGLRADVLSLQGLDLPERAEARAASGGA